MRIRMHAGRALAVGAALVCGGSGVFAQGMPSPGFGAPGAQDAMGNLGTRVHHEEEGLHGATGTGAASVAEVTGQRALESRKHLAEIDVQLKNAINHTKVLYNSTQLSPGQHDGMLRKESAAGIDAAIGSALEHAGHLRSLPEARIGDTRTLALLESDLNRARAIVSRLRTSLGLGSGVTVGVGSADRMQLSQQSAQLFGMLRSADDHFARIATELGLTRVDRITVPDRPPEQAEPRFDRQPVSGHAEPLRDRDRGDIDDEDFSQPSDDLGRPGSNY